MRFKRTKSKCAICPLQADPKVWGKGLMQGIAFIGEAPGSVEITKNEPFVGPAGDFFNWALQNAKIERSKNWVTNRVSSKLPNNDWDAFESDEAIIACSFGFEEELKALKKAGVKVLVTLGANPTHDMGIKGRISKVRGSVYQQKGFLVIPTYHPSYFQRMTYKRDDGSMLDKKVAWISDFMKAKRIAKNGWTPPKENFILDPKVEQICAWIKSALEDKAILAVDIETSGFGENSDIVVIGLARNSEDAISIPFFKKGGLPNLVNFALDKVNEWLNILFTEGRLMFQNALFDVSYLRRKGYNISYRNVAHDTMLLHHTIVPEQEHNLGYIVSIYGDTPYWKDAFAERDGPIYEMENDALRTYNLRDCVVLHQVLTPMLKDLKARDMEHIYYGEALPLLGPVGEMMENGITLDTKRLKEFKKTYERRFESLEQTLRSSKLGRLPNSINFDSADDMAYLLYGKIPPKFAKLADLAEYEPSTTTKRTKAGKPTLRKKGTETYNRLLALEEIRACRVRFSLPIGWKPRRTDGGKPGTNEQTLLSLAVAMGRRRADMERFRTLKPVHKEELAQYDIQDTWLKTYRKYRQVGKILSTYTSFPLRSDGRIHASFLIHGTTTGRLSSRDPNFQNLPKKEDEDSVGKEVREVFTADQGKVLVSCDYSNLEVRVLAYVTNDKPLIQMLESGVNMHDDNTKVLFNIDETSPKWKSARAAAKVFMFGGISYGGSDREIFEKLTMKAPSLGLKLKDFIRAKERWMGAHPGYSAWANEIKSTAATTRIAEVFTGRKRELMGKHKDIEKQALNSPIQGGAAAVINKATIKIHAEKPSKWKWIGQIHDQLIMEVAEDDGPKCAEFMQKAMSSPVEINNALHTFPVEASIGKSLGTLEEVKK